MCKVVSHSSSTAPHSSVTDCSALKQQHNSGKDSRLTWSLSSSLLSLPDVKEESVTNNASIYLTVDLWLALFIVLMTQHVDIIVNRLVVASTAKSLTLLLASYSTSVFSAGNGFDNSLLYSFMLQYKNCGNSIQLILFCIAQNDKFASRGLYSLCICVILCHETLTLVMFIWRSYGLFIEGKVIKIRYWS